jgi:hypothetical protein
MKSFCDACLKDVDTGAGTRCPLCGGDLSEDRKRRIHAEARAAEEELHGGFRGTDALGLVMAVVGGLFVQPYIGPTLEYYWAGDPNAQGEANLGMCVAGGIIALVGGGVAVWGRWSGGGGEK